MDDPRISPSRHTRALRGLERINRWSLSAQAVWGPIRSLARAAGGGPVRILDLATGAGDAPIRMWHLARRSKCPVRIDGCDRSPVAVRYARDRSARSGADVRFFELDVLSRDLPAGYDVLTSSLFLHHLDEADARRLLRNMARAAGRMVVIDDLERSVIGLGLAYAATQLLTRSDVVQTDGPRSVRAAFTIDEARRLACDAGLRGITIARRWPCRYRMVWRRRAPHEGGQVLTFNKSVRRTRIHPPPCEMSRLDPLRAEQIHPFALFNVKT